MDLATLMIVGVVIVFTAGTALLAVRSASRRQAQLETAVREELRQGREEAARSSRELREELANCLNRSQAQLASTLMTTSEFQKTELNTLSGQIRELTSGTTASLERSRGTLEARLDVFQEAVGAKLEEIRRTADERLTTAINTGQKAMLDTLSEIGKLQREQLETMSVQIREMSASNRGALDRIRETVDVRVRELQEGNDRKLEEMRRTVDEKLHETLERRLGDSFNVVSERLEAVQRGLGEMQSLANGVGDLKRVLSNVKTRGTWAEIQLGAILEQILAPSQYERNVRVKDDCAQAVEYAIRIPRQGNGSYVWLPIDSKFPHEDYSRLQEAAERGDADAVQRATDSLNRAIRSAAQDIRNKYVSPPDTTDFGILYLATEGLYAEVIRQPALVEDLHQRYRVVAAGPTTLAAILSSLRMGFQTVAVEQRAAEVRTILAAVKTEFAKFGDVLDKVKRQLRAASNSIEATGVRTRAMERKLRAVEELPEEEASRLLALPSLVEEVQDEQQEFEQLVPDDDDVPF